MDHGKYVCVHLFLWCTASLKCWYLYSEFSSKAYVHACLTKCYKMIERNNVCTRLVFKPGAPEFLVRCYLLSYLLALLFESLPSPKWSLHTKITIFRLFPQARVTLSIPEVGTANELGWEKYNRPDWNSHQGSLNFILGALSMHWAIGPWYSNRSDQHIKSLNIEDLHMLVIHEKCDCKF